MVTTFCCSSNHQADIKIKVKGAVTFYKDKLHKTITIEGYL